MAKTLLERYGKPENLSVLHLLEAETTAPKPPTEVDRMRLKQKQETLMLKKRQASELLTAQSRELQKDAREKLAKASQPKKTS